MVGSRDTPVERAAEVNANARTASFLIHELLDLIVDLFPVIKAQTKRNSFTETGTPDPSAALSSRVACRATKTASC